MVELVQNKRPDLDSVIETDAPKKLGLIPAWSHSTLKTFETCAYRSYIAKVRRIQEDYGPAAARGSEIHGLAEDYVQAKIAELPKGEWGFTIEWEACHWMAKDVWARIKLDAIVHETETSARVIDYKTGKMFGNEISHSQQALTYAIGSFFRYPDLQHVQTELWYLDHGETTRQAYTRDEAMIFMPKLHERAIVMTTATKFPPNPSSYSCKWCFYKKGDDPVCQHALK